MNGKLTVAGARALVEAANQLDSANALLSTVDRMPEVQKLSIRLDQARTSANPFPVNFPFRSVFVASATDATTRVTLRPNSIDGYQDGLPIGLRDSFVLPFQSAAGFLTWDAQPGKTIDLYFFVTGEFRSGSQIQLTAGGVSIIDGAFATEANLTTVATTVLQVFAQDFLRKKGTIQNNTGGSVWIGATNAVSNTGVNRGFEIKPGEVYFYRNTAALYAYPAANATNGLYTRSDS